MNKKHDTHAKITYQKNTIKYNAYNQFFQEIKGNMKKNHEQLFPLNESRDRSYKGKAQVVFEHSLKCKLAEILQIVTE